MATDYNNISALKEKFYQHFPDYLDFLNNLNLDPNNNPKQLNKVLNELSEKSDKKLYHRDKYGDVKFPNVTPQNPITEEEAVTSVEWFFDYFGGKQEELKKISEIITFIETSSGNGSTPEMENLKEDIILKAICKYFWNLSTNKKVIVFEKQVHNKKSNEWETKQVCYEYENFGNYDYYGICEIISRLLSGDKDYYFKDIIHLCRKIRNNNTHELIEFFGLKEGREVYRFILFTYIATVLFLRRKIKDKYQFQPVKLHVLGAKQHEVSLVCTNTVIPSKRDNTGFYFEVYWYKDYTLRFNRKDNTFLKNFNFDWTAIDPVAIISEEVEPIKINPNESKGRSTERLPTFGRLMEAVNIGLGNLKHIDENTTEIADKLDLLDEICQAVKDINKNKFNEILKQQSEWFGKLLSAIDNQTDASETYREENKELLNQIIGLLRQQNEKDDIRTILEFLYNEREKKAARQQTVYLILQGLVLLISVVVFLWHILKDNSALWLTNKWLYLLFAVLIPGAAVVCSLKLKNLKKILRVSAPLLTIAFVLGSLLLIPAKTEKSYDFAKHTAQENAKVVALMESSLEKDNTDDENILRQLVTYYLKYGDDVPKARRYAEKLRDVNKYPESCVVAAEALLATHKDYFELKDLITKYREKYDTLHPTLERILGIQMLFGLGMKQSHPNAVSHFATSGKKGDIPSCYYLGYAFSHDMTNWHELEVEAEVELSQYNLAQAVYYYTLASQSGEPRASLDLGKLYADLNLNDSAIVYYKKTIDQCDHLPGIRDNLRMLSAAKFQMGLVLNRQGVRNDYIYEAKNAGYEPAILYSAIKEEDHKTAIDRYLKAGEYTGYRYIPPIVFEYIAIGDSVNALKYLQSSRPEGKFDMAFVSAMQRIVGSPYVAKDSIHANQLMLESANEGCKFAKLFCHFREIQRELERNPSIDVASLYKKSSELRVLSKEIPFGYALDGWIWQKKEWSSTEETDALPASAQAIRKGHPAGAFVLGGTLPLFVNNPESRTNPENGWKYAWYSGLYQMAIRMSSNKQGSDTTLGFRQVAIGMSFDYFMWFHHLNEFSFFADYDYSFWSNVLIANHCFDQIVYLAFVCKPKEDSRVSEYWFRLLDAAMECATPACDKDMLSVTSSYINLYPDFLEQMKEKYKNDEFKYNLLVSGEFNNLHDGEKIEMKLNYIFSRLRDISDIDLISEFTTLTDDFYEFTIKEEENKYGFY